MGVVDTEFSSRLAKEASAVVKGEHCALIWWNNRTDNSFSVPFVCAQPHNNSMYQTLLFNKATGPKSLSEI